MLRASTARRRRTRSNHRRSAVATPNYSYEKRQRETASTNARSYVNAQIRFEIKL